MRVFLPPIEEVAFGEEFSYIVCEQSQEQIVNDDKKKKTNWRKKVYIAFICNLRNHFISEWEKPNNGWPCSKVSAPFWSKQDLVHESGDSGIMTEVDSWRVSWSPQLAIALSKICLGYKVNSLMESPRSRYKAEDIVIKLTSNTVS